MFPISRTLLLASAALSFSLQLPLVHGQDADSSGSAQAPDAAVTLHAYDATWPPRVNPRPGTVLGVEPVSIDDAGATHYRETYLYPAITMTFGGMDGSSTYDREASTTINTFHADATAYHRADAEIPIMGNTYTFNKTSHCAESPDQKDETTGAPLIVCEEILELEELPEATDAAGSTYRPFIPANTVTVSTQGPKSAWITISASAVEAFNAQATASASASASGGVEDMDEDSGAERIVLSAFSAAGCMIAAFALLARL